MVRLGVGFYSVEGVGFGHGCGVGLQLGVGLVLVLVLVLLLSVCNILCGWDRVGRYGRYFGLWEAS